MSRQHSLSATSDEVDQESDEEFHESTDEIPATVANEENTTAKPMKQRSEDVTSNSEMEETADSEVDGCDAGQEHEVIKLPELNNESNSINSSTNDVNEKVENVMNVNDKVENIIDAVENENAIEKQATDNVAAEQNESHGLMEENIESINPERAEKSEKEHKKNKKSRKQDNDKTEPEQEANVVQVAENLESTVKNEVSAEQHTKKKKKLHKEDLHEAESSQSHASDAAVDEKEQAGEKKKKKKKKEKKSLKSDEDTETERDENNVENAANNSNKEKNKENFSIKEDEQKDNLLEGKNTENIAEMHQHNRAENITEEIENVTVEIEQPIVEDVQHTIPIKNDTKEQIEHAAVVEQPATASITVKSDNIISDTGVIVEKTVENVIDDHQKDNKQEENQVDDSKALCSSSNIEKPITKTEEEVCNEKILNETAEITTEKNEESDKTSEEVAKSSTEHVEITSELQPKITDDETIQNMPENLAAEVPLKEEILANEANEESAYKQLKKILHDDHHEDITAVSQQQPSVSTNLVTSQNEVKEFNEITNSRPTLHRAEDDEDKEILSRSRQKARRLVDQQNMLHSYLQDISRNFRSMELEAIVMKRDIMIHKYGVIRPSRRHQSASDNKREAHNGISY